MDSRKEQHTEPQIRHAYTNKALQISYHSQVFELSCKHIDVEELDM